MKKTKILAIALLGGFTLQQVALSQTNAAGTNQTVAATNQAIVTAVSNVIAAAGMTNEPAATGTNSQPVAATSTNQPSTEVANIPLISFQDVPITTAIENLARQAGINYLLDPKVGYGQPDANGQIKPEPTLSIRWENITAEHALVALLDNYGLELIKDPKTGIARITVKEPGALPPLITRVIQLKYASTSNMVQSVQAALSDKRSHVLPDDRTSQLVVVATEPEQTSVDTLINELDKPTRQVLIETRLVELSSTPSTTKGIDWSGTLQAQNVSGGNTSQFLVAPTAPTSTTTSGGAVVTTPGNPGIVNGILGNPAVVASTISGFGSAGFLNADGLKAVISFLNQDSDAQVISTPRVVTLDNEAATISVTTAFPVINTTAGTQGSPGGSTISYSNLGTILVVTPRISANDHIWLKVDPQVSNFSGKDTETIAGAVFTADIFDYREITTQVLIPNANTLVMGGLVTDNMTSGYNTVPVLGAIPVVGLAFRHESKSMTKGNLLIFITPTIVQDGDFHPTATGFLQNQSTPVKSVMDANNIWNRAKVLGQKTYDWSDPGTPLPKSGVTNDDSNVEAEKSMNSLDTQENAAQAPAPTPAVAPTSSNGGADTNAPVSLPTSSSDTNASTTSSTNVPANDTNTPPTAGSTNAPANDTNAPASGDTNSSASH